MGLSHRAQGGCLMTGVIPHGTSNLKKSLESLQGSPQRNAAFVATDTICRPPKDHHRLVQVLLEAVSEVGR